MRARNTAETITPTMVITAMARWSASVMGLASSPPLEAPEPSASYGYTKEADSPCRE